MCYDTARNAYILLISFYLRGTTHLIRREGRYWEGCPAPREVVEFVLLHFDALSYYVK